MPLLTLRAKVFRKAMLWPLAATGLGLVLFLWRFDPAVVPPRNFDQLLAAGGDPAMNTLGWEYFRSEPWSWPPGRCVSYGAPFGSSIGLVDAVPLLALPGKLFAGGRTGPWQYFGSWILATYLLQALVSWHAVGLVLRHNLPRLAATALLLLMPSFLTRTGHMALNAHWLVLLGLVLYGRGAGPAAWLLLAGVASLSHPYHAFMVLVVAGAWQLKAWLVDRVTTLLRVLAMLLALSALVAAGWWISGMFVYGLGANDEVYGFGRFSANLNTLINPLRHARLLRPLPLVYAEQVEGFNYLGLGLLPLWFLAAARSLPSRAAWRRFGRHWPLLLVLAGLTLFALSQRITCGDRVLREVELPGSLLPLTNAFRASGRLLWPVTYAGTLFAFWSLGRTVGVRLQTAMLAILLLVQIIDLGPTLGRRTHFHQERIDSRLADPAWPAVMARTERLLTVPPLEAGTQFPYDFRDLDLPLVSRGVPTSAAYLTRNDAALARQWTTEYLADLARGRRLEPGTTLVVRDTALVPWLAALTPDFTAYNLDGFRVLVDSSIVLPGALAYLPPQPMDLPTFLAAHDHHILAIAAKDEATRELGERARAALAKRGLAVDLLAFRCSFAALLDPAGGSWQEIRTDGDVQHAVDGPARLELHSAGLPHGNRVSIRLDGVEQAISRRGLNILVLDEKWQPLALGLFDTFVGEAGWSLEYRRVPD